MTNTKPQKPKRLARSEQVRLFSRDHWLCHMCKRPVVFAPAMKYLQKMMPTQFSNLAYWQSSFSREGAPLLDELAAVLDHVDPQSRGGASDYENLKTACNKCNSRKSDLDYKRWIAQNPTRKNRGKEPKTWDGFSSLFVFLAEKEMGNLTATEKLWLEALPRTSSRGK